MPLTCLRWMARTFAAGGLITGYGRAGRRCLRPLVIRCGSIDARGRGVPMRRPIRTDPMRRCMTMARSRAEPRVFAPTGCPICLEGLKNSAPASHTARRSAATLPLRFDRGASQGPQQCQRRRPPMFEGMDRNRDAPQSGPPLSRRFHPNRDTLLGTRTEWKNTVIYSRAAYRDVPKSCIAQR